MRERDHASLRVHQRENRVGRDLAASRLDLPIIDPSRLEGHPRIDVGRVLPLGADDVLTSIPIETLREQRDSVSRASCQRDRLRDCVDELADQAAHAVGLVL